MNWGYTQRGRFSYVWSVHGRRVDVSGVAFTKRGAERKVARWKRRAEKNESSP